MKQDTIPQSAIEKIRRFQRAVTSEVGALDASFLGRGRPLGPARVINAVGQGKHEVSEIRQYLGLDSGLMSRLLRGLEEDGLIQVSPSPLDSRKRSVSLTQSGEQEFIAYERLSNERAEKILNQFPHPQKLLDAMAIIANAFGSERFIFTEVDPADDDAQACMQAYYAELAQRFDTGFDVNLSRDPELEEMRRPVGTFIVVYADGCPIACTGLKGTHKGYAEIKRVWVSPEARGLGITTRLMKRVEDIAQELGYSLLRLDTNSVLKEAVSFYRKHGWKEIMRFNDDPYPDLFFEKHL